MKCPYCSSENLKVIDSRDASDANAIRRRRECSACQRRFTTFETIELTMQVHKRDGRYEEFQQHKLAAGLEASCQHTNINREEVIALADKIKREIMLRHESVITTQELGDVVMKHLLELDPVAYIRFACVYRRFKDIGDVMREVQSAQQSIPQEESTNAT